MTTSLDGSIKLGLHPRGLWLGTAVFFSRWILLGADRIFVHILKVGWVVKKRLELCFFETGIFWEQFQSCFQVGRWNVGAVILRWWSDCWSGSKKVVFRRVSQCRWQNRHGTIWMASDGFLAEGCERSLEKITEDLNEDIVLSLLHFMYNMTMW